MKNENIIIQVFYINILIVILSHSNCIYSQNFTLILEENEKALSHCTSKQETRIRNENFCLYNITIDKSEKEFYLKNDFGVKECCFMQEINEHLKVKNGYCNFTNIMNNGTIVKQHEKSYETICIPFDYKEYMDKKLENYNEPLIPCAENKIIDSSNDCFYYGDDSNFCCHVYGNIEGIKVNQCYYMSRSISPKSGIFDSKILKFVCKSINLHCNSILFYFLLIIFIFQIN